MHELRKRTMIKFLGRNRDRKPETSTIYIHLPYQSISHRNRTRKCIENPRLRTRRSASPDFAARRSGNRPITCDQCAMTAMSSTRRVCQIRRNVTFEIPKHHMIIWFQWKICVYPHEIPMFDGQIPMFHGVKLWC